MLDQSIWWFNMMLEAALLVRGLSGKWVSRYRVFYIYIFFVLFQSLVRFYLFSSDSSVYADVYWSTEFLAVILGCGITFEIYRVGLSAYPGTARMARNLLCIIFVLAATKALVDASTDPRWWPIATTSDLELALRVVQAGSIGALVVLFLIYKVPFGRNLRGIVLGYGLFVTLTAVQYAFISVQGEHSLPFWSNVQSFAYLLVLGIWAAHLWSYEEVPEPQATVRLELEYQRMAAATRQRLRAARGYVGKVVGS